MKQSGESSGKVEVNVGNKSGNDNSGNGGNNNNRNANGNRRNRNRGSDPSKRPRFQTYENYSPLNDTLENIYLDTYNVLQYKRPPPRDSTEKEMATGKFCLFHGTHGHSTNECRHLRDVIEKLLREGKLDEYKVAPRDRGQGEQAPKQILPAPKPTAQQKGKGIVINSIVGGPHLAIRSFRAMDQICKCCQAHRCE